MFRRVIVRLVPFVSSRPWLVALAARVFAAAPWIKPLLRHMVSSPASKAVLPSEMTPLEAAVLTDLRQASRTIHAPRE